MRKKKYSKALRSSERAAMVEALLFSITNRTNPRLESEFAKVLFLYIESLNLVKKPLARPKNQLQKDARRLLHATLMRITAFSGVKEEQYMIIVELHDAVADLVTGQFKSAFEMWQSVAFNTK